MGKSEELLFQYLCDIVYDIDAAFLSLEKIDQDHQMLGEGLIQLHTLLKEERAFAFALAKGNLSVDPPSSENELASPLKSLHASLRHLSWQSQKVAQGDYQQIVNFMGEFSDAFNTMTQQLDKRQKALEEEIASGKKKTEALKQSNEILTHITLNSTQMILLFDKETGKIVYRNKSASAAVKQMPGFLQELVRAAKAEEANSTGATEISVLCNDKKRYFSVTFYRLFWEGKLACALVVQDITEEKENLEKLKRRASIDEMTGINNRRAGMEILGEWLKRKKAFVMCFFDLDNLKYVNDTYGHDEGDNYIIESAALIGRAFENGFPCRLGGDEFMLLVPDATYEQVEKRLNALHDDFKDEVNYQRRISYGCVAVSPDENRTAKQLLGIADERMYAFKRRHKEIRAR